ncbi:MAG: hypothetical protein HY986_07645 [Candidatus Melainabacteria bacterium]|nr:hypothetical protein [Candidatus Melainabacteria bacterium]
MNMYSLFQFYVKAELACNAGRRIVVRLDQDLTFFLSRRSLPIFLNEAIRAGLKEQLDVFTCEEYFSLFESESIQELEFRPLDSTESPGGRISIFDVMRRWLGCCDGRVVERGKLLLLAEVTNPFELFQVDLWADEVARATGLCVDWFKESADSSVVQVKYLGEAPAAFPSELLDGFPGKIIKVGLET